MIPEAVQVLEALHSAMRAVGVHGVDSGDAAVESTLRELSGALIEARPPLALTFLDEAVFRAGRLLPLTVEGYRRARQVGLALERLGFGQIEFSDLPSEQRLALFCQLLWDAAQGRTSSVDQEELDCIELKKVARLRLGANAPVAEREVYCDTQLRAASDSVSLLLARDESAWPWDMGLTVVRRLENAVAADLLAAARSLESANEWTRSRRVMGAGFHVASVLWRLGARAPARRAAVHAVILLSAHGLLERFGRDVTDAAFLAFDNALSAPRQSKGRPDPHRVRVATLLSELRGHETHRMPLSALIRLGYDLERQRCPQGVSFSLSRVDLHAWVAKELGKGVDWRWGRAFLGSLGALPAGSYATVDGCLAQVHDGKDPRRPEVLVAGEIKVADGDVTLHSAIGMTPWGKAGADV